MIADVAEFADRWHVSLGLAGVGVGLVALLVDVWWSKRRSAGTRENVTRGGVLAVALVGLWATIPDTEAPLFVGTALCPILIARVVTGRDVGPAGSLAVLGAYAVAAVIGSAGRAPAIAGAVCCAVLPIGLVVAGDRGRRIPSVVAVGVEIVVCVLASRVIGHL